METGKSTLRRRGRVLQHICASEDWSKWGPERQVTGRGYQGFFRN